MRKILHPVVARAESLTGIILDQGAYRVVHEGHLCSPAWHDQGPADAYVDMLVQGRRTPEYEAS